MVRKLGSGPGHTLLTIKSHMKVFTKTEELIAKYVLENGSDVIYLSVTELAEKVGVGETTVLRFCRKLKFSGFQDFKLSLAQDLVQTEAHLHGDVAENDETGTLIRKVIAEHQRIIDETMGLLDPNKAEQAVDALLHADKVCFFGVGSSGLTAMEAAQSFARIGKLADAKQDAHFQAMNAALLTERDVAVGFSISGSTKDTIKHLGIAKKLGAKVICITHNARSPITQIADIELLMAARENPLQGSSLPARVSQLAVLDILCVAVSLRMKETAIHYRKKTAKAVTEKLY